MVLRGKSTATINEGEVYLVNGGVLSGATVTASAPIGVELTLVEMIITLHAMCLFSRLPGITIPTIHLFLQQAGLQTRQIQQ